MKCEEISFAVHVLVGRAELPMLGYCDLQIGDILLLDQKVGSPFSMVVGEEERFRGYPGLKAAHKAVKIYE